ncbi:MAG: acyl-CoA synthetase [Phyllobacteriaceae bacterium]|nr:acyl-CoA synthetase [Phyllobacteriaceae bacterium]
MLPDAASYGELLDRFRWDVPKRFNMGAACCDRWAETEPDRTALIVDDEDRTVSFGELQDLSNRMASLLATMGVSAGDRVGVLLPQTVETAAGHIAIYKMGAIAVPLFVLFGPDALEHRIVDAGISHVITNREGAAKLRAMSTAAQDGLCILTVDGAHDDLGTGDLHTLLADQPSDFEPVDTAADDPALIIYTSGTTGAPKGALHAHRVLLGHLPGVEMHHEFFPQPGDVIWTPADWAWIGGLLDVLLPALFHGVPVVARRFDKFTAEDAFELMARRKVTNAFLPPTALKMMRAACPEAPPPPLALRTVGSGGESLGAELIDWGRRVLGVTINEFYGQTECNLVISSCSALMDAQPGVMGRPVPGHTVAVLREDGSQCAEGEEGLIAVRRPDPVMFLEYWNNPEATAAKFVSDWLVMGDVGLREPGGWIRFVGRDDDVITSAGYRIGPGGIEDCLIRHPAVRMAAAVGKPDAERTEIVKAYVVLADGHALDAALEAELQAHVRERLAAHEYPREIEALDELPVTTTGKIMRRVLRERASREG